MSQLYLIAGLTRLAPSKGNDGHADGVGSFGGSVGRVLIAALAVRVLHLITS